MDGYITKYVVYIYAVQYYSAMRRKDLLPFTATWVDLEHIMHINKLDRNGQLLYDLLYLWTLKKVKLIKTE